MGRDGVKQDHKQAFRLYCQAALQGDAESAFNLGFMYFNGRGVHRDQTLAIHWFQKAADAGDIHAKQLLTLFSPGNTVQDPQCAPAPAVVASSDNNPARKKVEALVNRIAPDYGIDPKLVMAVIRAESDFNPTAQSGKKAFGLMQLVPKTAQRFGVKDSANPAQNIKGGTAYLQALLQQFDGKVDWALAAYNAGEAAVQRYQGIPPYQETRKYVKQILAWYPKSLHPIPSKSGEADAKS
jgi:soluble lytic murein transglycosylase-like protein